MKKILLGIILILVVIGGFYWINNYIYNEKQEGSQNALRFEEYAVSEAFSGEVAEPDFSSYPGSENFRTVITEGVKEGPNFAGHYTVVSWGCGTSCQSSAILDARNGKIVAYGIISAYGLSFREDSSLLIVNPKENIPDLLLEQIQNDTNNEHYPLGSFPRGADYYVFENNELKFIDRYSFANNEGTFCIQVISPARNPVTGETRDFPTPCSIPFGWEALESAEGEI